MTVTKRAIVLDADWIIFKALSGAEIETQWEDDVWTLEADHKLAWKAMENHIDALMGAVQKRHPTDLLIPVMCYTDSYNWRKDILPTYKSNRIGKRKPTGYKHFMERVYTLPEYNSFLRYSLEGDDCMGIIGSMPQLVKCDVATIVSCDKDFKTIPCEFYHQSVNPQFNPHKWYETTQEQADYWHMYQTLIGDTADGYTGIKGMGETTAIAFLDKPYMVYQAEKTFKSGARKGQTVLEWKKRELEDSETLWEAIVALGVKAGMTYDECLVQAQVARICRAEDYDFKHKKVILWKPLESFY